MTLLIFFLQSYFSFQDFTGTYFISIYNGDRTELQIPNAGLVFILNRDSTGKGVEWAECNVIQRIDFRWYRKKNDLIIRIDSRENKNDSIGFRERKSRLILISEKDFFKSNFYQTNTSSVFDKMLFEKGFPCKK